MRFLAYAIAALMLAALGALGWRQVHALQEARSSLASLEPGPVDVGFSQSMSLHHQQAIGMAQLLLDGRPTSLAPLARRIADAQLIELGQMRGWLQLWNEPLQRPARDMGWMRLGAQPPDAELQQYLLDCSRAPTGMAGLATDAEMLQLRQLEGRPRDELFLKLMVAHHEGGVPMARFAAREARLPAVRRLAGQVVVDQLQEIARMQHLLAVAAAMPGQGVGR